jgi:hypothetical protein
LDPWPLDEGQRPKLQIKANLHGSILEGKSIGSNHLGSDPKPILFYAEKESL